MPFLAILVAFSLNSCKPDKPDNPDNSDSTGLQGLVPSGWQVQIVDSAANCVVGDYNKIAVDKNNGVHLIYTVETEENDVSLRYAYKPDAGNWTIETITTPDGIATEQMDMAVSSNKVYVIYQDKQDNSEIHLTSKAIGSGSWTDQIFDDSYSARYPRLFIDDNDVVFVSYTHSNDGQYFGIVGGTQQKISDESDNPNDIVVDKDGVVHIFYTKHYDLHHIYSNNYTDWTDEVIYTYSDEYLQQPDATVDTAGNISVAMTLDMVSDGCRFFYKKYGETSFSNSIPVSTRFSYGKINMAVDLSGHQYFTAYTMDDNCVFLGDKDANSSKWNTTLLLKSEKYRYGITNDIAIDKDYGIHISSNGGGNIYDNKIYYLYKEKK